MIEIWSSRAQSTILTNKLFNANVLIIYIFVACEPCPSNSSSRIERIKTIFLVKVACKTFQKKKGVKLVIKKKNNDLVKSFMTNNQ